MLPFKLAYTPGTKRLVGSPALVASLVVHPALSEIRPCELRLPHDSNTNKHLLPFQGTCIIHQLHHMALKKRNKASTSVVRQTG
ncbi:hypothetical protein GGR57DRAFT_85329 [Xylariaceae sp. FL1272]|nr:hypothetical protein GGR57DRAFT_85329 [Xylariaceae sp. FL1272]